MIGKIADPAKNSISLILFILIYPGTKVKKIRLIYYFIHFFESNEIKTVESGSSQISNVQIIEIPSCQWGVNLS